MCKQEIHKYVTEDSDTPKYSAYGHLKKEVASKSKSQSQSVASTTIPTPLKAFFVIIIIFGGLLFTGVLTGPGPFIGNNNNNDNQGTGFIDDGADNSAELSSVCVQHTGLSAHYHYDLIIIINNVRETIPANVGIPSTDCYRPIHTHDASGHIHVELPSGYSGGAPTVADFFAIWGKTFTPTSLLGNAGTVTMEVNSVIQTGNFQFYIPADGDQVVLVLAS